DGDAGSIAERGLVAGRIAIDDRHGDAVAAQRKGRREADDAGADDDGGLIAQGAPRTLDHSSITVARMSPSVATASYSIFKPCLATSAAHLSSSRLIFSAYCSGVLGAGSSPRETRRFLKSSAASIVRSSLLSRSTIGRGTPAGAVRP